MKSGRLVEDYCSDSGKIGQGLGLPLEWRMVGF